jgi:anti-sigma factor RsiW
MSEEELISAYVDGQLSEAERASFEARLASDPELRRRVLATRLLVSEARQLPMVAPPRNFILPPDVARRPAVARSRFPRWAYQLGALAAMVLCIALIVWDVGLPSAQPELATLPAQPAAQPMVPDAPAEERLAPFDAEPRAFALPESTPAQTPSAPSAPAEGTWVTPPRVFAFLLLALAIGLGILGWGRRG